VREKKAQEAQEAQPRRLEVSARKSLAIYVGLAALLLTMISPVAAQADFGIKSMSAGALNEDESIDLQAGSRPYEFRLGFEMNLDSEEAPEGKLRDLIVDLPPGMVGNPLAVRSCSGADFEGVTPQCPADSQVGVALVHIPGLQLHGGAPIYNLTPPLGVPASVGFSIVSNNVFNEASLRSSDYGARISDTTIPTTVEIQSVEARIWGVPLADSHDPQRFCQKPGGGGTERGCGSESAATPFLSLPTSCNQPLKWTISVDSLEEPGVFHSASAESVGPGGTPRSLNGCDKPPFSPTLSFRPETAVSDSATGVHVNVRIPQNEELPEAELEPINEVQALEVDPTAGTFTLSFKGESTGELAFNASPAEVQSELESLSSIGSENVLISGGGGTYFITFVGKLSHTDVPLVEGVFSGGKEGEVRLERQGRPSGEFGPGPGIASAHLKDTVVTLPPGLAVNPSAGDGRAGCPLVGPQGINLPGSGEPAQSEPAKCPDNSKVGTVEVHSPLVDHPIHGTVYLAKQGENPFGSLIALYVAVNDPQTGVVVKLAGKVEPDPTTGQVRTIFQNNPQLPFETFDFDFSGGPRAPLTTPPTCGTYTTTTDLTPWTTPEGADAFPSDPFQISSSPGGGCVASEAQMPNTPSFEAGTETPLAGAYSPFVLHLSRENGSQRFAAVNMTLPPGVAANFSGVAECSEAQIAQAQARGNPGQGALEKQNPSCPPGSQIGVVNVGAGSGSPIFVQGNVYLAGPYKGAPFSLAIITPGIAGPFDIGTVVARAALYVNEETGQGTVKSDPLPTILAGIPLDIRSIAVKIDRSGYVLNPTSCEAKEVSGEAITTTGAVAQLKNRFQVGGCRGLDYTPKLSLSLRGGTRRSAHPALKSVLTQPSGQANSRKITVILPSTEFIDPVRTANPCTRPQFAAGQCPPASVLGKARVFTPLFDKPLEGPVYFRANGGARALPDAVADLHGRVHAVVVGFVDAAHKKGSERSRVRTTFANVPDVPVTKAIIELRGGKKGTLVNSANLCKVRPIATVKMVAQNNKVQQFDRPMATSCKK
jgi:hypothetical protein